MTNIFEQLRQSLIPQELYTEGAFTYGKLLNAMKGSCAEQHLWRDTWAILIAEYIPVLIFPLLFFLLPLLIPLVLSTLLSEFFSPSGCHCVHPWGRFWHKMLTDETLSIILGSTLLFILIFGFSLHFYSHVVLFPPAPSSVHPPVLYHAGWSAK